MKRDEHVNDIPDIEIVDLENETVQDTDFGKSDISDDFEGNPDDEYEEKYNSFRIPICGSVDWVLPAICLPVCLLHRQSHE